jgi:outer membrane immunogenic protein
MKKSLLGLVAIGALIAGPAMAADLGMPLKAPPAPVAPAYSWTGFYIGVNGGWADGHTDWTYNFIPVAPVATAGHNTNGGLFGGTVGVNYQFSGNWVIGAEADWDWADIDGSTACPNAAFSCQSKISDFGTARGRLGYAWDRLLVYGTGGAAWGDVTIQTTNIAGIPQPCNVTGTALAATCGTKATRTGWAAGAGLEYAVWQSLSIKAEWIHYDLGSGTFNVDDPAGQFVTARESGDIFRGGLNWRFNFGGPIATRY